MMRQSPFKALEMTNELLTIFNNDWESAVLVLQQFRKHRVKNPELRNPSYENPELRPFMKSQTRFS